MKMLKNEKGFTLIELVLIIVVLGVLAAVATLQFGSVIGDSKDASIQGLAGATNGQLALAVNELKALPTGGAGNTFDTEVYAKLVVSGSDISKSAFDGVLDRFAICTLSGTGTLCTIGGTVAVPTAAACGSTTNRFVQVSYTASSGALAISAPKNCTS